MSSIARKLLLEMYNRTFLLYTIPDEWNKYLVFYIPKAEESLKFRPISLASCLCKVFERMIVNRLNWFFEFNNLLPTSQFGLRRSKSCIDNLSILQTNILLSFQKNQLLLTINNIPRYQSCL